MSNTAPAAEAIPVEGKGAGLAVADPQTLTWAEVTEALSGGGWRWLATVRPDGAPHVVPVFAALSTDPDPVLFVSSNDAARKSRNLAADGRCVVTADTGRLHIVVEGTARRARDAATLERARAAYDASYSWPTTVSGEYLDAEYGAPTSLGPPYGVYAITPAKVLAFPSGADFMPTRWRFDA